jgi:hypothetical protein
LVTFSLATQRESDSGREAARKLLPVGVDAAARTELKALGPSLRWGDG